MSITMQPPETDLPLRLKAGTREWHQRAERSGAMAQLLQGRLEAPGYVLMLRALQAIYGALERGLRAQASHPLVACLPLQGLARGDAITSDLRALHDVMGADFGRRLPPAAVGYARRLNHLVRGPRPWLLIAHAYVRYLGDLHGGQVLRERVARLLGPVAIDATAFYDFGDPAAVRVRIAALRAGLQGVGQREPGAIDALVREAQRGFAWHVRLFEQIASDNAVQAQAPMVPAQEQARQSRTAA
jgi:heme oxygenase (biliverdin-producing, ferredoxin)